MNKRKMTQARAAIKRMETKDKITIGLSTTALIVSVLSSTYSYYSNVAEDIALYVSTHSGDKDYIASINHGIHGSFPASVGLFWQVAMINNGTTHVNVVDSRMAQVSPEFPQVVSWMASRFFRDEENKLPLPISLKPGEVKKALIHVDVPLTEDVYKRLSTKFKPGSRASERLLFGYLAKQGIDYYGNKMSMDKDFGYVRNPGQTKFPVFSLSLETSRGKTVSAEFSVISGLAATSSSQIR